MEWDVLQGLGSRGRTTARLTGFGVYNWGFGLLDSLVTARLFWTYRFGRLNLANMADELC